MVAVPCVQYRFTSFCGYRGDKVKWARCVVRLSESGFVQLLEVNCSSGFSVLLRGDNHSGTPRGGRSLRDFLDYS